MEKPKSIDQYPAPAPSYKPIKKVRVSKKKETAAESGKPRDLKNFDNTTIYTQLAKFQELNIVIPRNGTGKIDGREYKYATLDDTINMTKGPLSTLGITMMQIIQDGKLRTVFFHVNRAGEKSEIFSEIEVPKPNSTQDLGTSITYLRRYTIAPLLGLTSEQDLDAGKGIPPTATPGTTSLPNVPAPIVQAPMTEAMDQVGPTIIDAIDDVQKAPKSEFYNKALGMINAATSEQALDLIRTQIGRSTNFTDVEKNELYEMVDTRETEVEGTVR